MSEVAFTVFSKSWKSPLPEMAAHLAGMGFEGVELPVRPHFQVTPDNVAAGLPEAARVLADHGLKIGSVAGPTDEPTIAACGAVGVPIIRICCDIPPETAYLAAEADLRRRFDALLPVLADNGVAIGVQNHCDRCVSTVMGMRHLIEGYDPAQVCAVLDFGHCGLAGERADLAIDGVWSHLRLVNFKNAYWTRANGPEAQAARWRHCWTTGRDGMADWADAAGELKRRKYAGDVCMSAEYSDAESVDRLAAEDLAYVKSLFAGEAVS